MDHENARKGREHSIFAKFESETGVGIYYQIRIQISRFRFSPNMDDGQLYGKSRYTLHEIRDKSSLN